MEACLLSISNSNIAEISQRMPKVGSIWKRFKSNIQKPIAVILIINTLAHTIGAAISGAQFDELYGPKWILVFSIAYSLFMIQYTEILPKTLGVRFNVFLAKSSAVPLLFLVNMFRPLTAFIELANRPFSRKADGGSNSIATEITLLASSAVYEKTLSQEQADLISKSIQISTVKAHDIMVDKDHIVSLNDTMSLNEAFLAVHVHRHTRYPLVEGHNWNEVLGYVNFKDIVTALHIAPKNPSLKGICRTILFVTENTPIDLMLKKMIREHQHIALVRDNNQDVVGLVTLEDAIESLVGDIEDEFDKPPEMIVNLSESRWRVGGGVSISELREVVSKEIPEVSGTIDDYVKSRLEGKELEENVQVKYHGVTINVRRISRDYVYDAILEITKNSP